jgi:hypothetical protein
MSPASDQEVHADQREVEENIEHEEVEGQEDAQ